MPRYMGARSAKADHMYRVVEEVTYAESGNARTDTYGPYTSKGNARAIRTRIKPKTAGDWRLRNGNKVRIWIEETEVKWEVFEV